MRDERRAEALGVSVEEYRANRQEMDERYKRRREIIGVAVNTGHAAYAAANIVGRPALYHWLAKQKGLGKGAQSLAIAVGVGDGIAQLTWLFANMLGHKGPNALTYIDWKLDVAREIARQPSLFTRLFKSRPAPNRWNPHPFKNPKSTRSKQ